MPPDRRETVPWKDLIAQYLVETSGEREPHSTETDVTSWAGQPISDAKWKEAKAKWESKQRALSRKRKAERRQERMEAKAWRKVERTRKREKKARKAERQNRRKARAERRAGRERSKAEGASDRAHRTDGDDDTNKIEKGDNENQRISPAVIETSFIQAYWLIASYYMFSRFFQWTSRPCV